MTKSNINNAKRVLNTIIEQIIHITGSNHINTYKLLPVHAFAIVRLYILKELRNHIGKLFLCPPQK